MSNEAALATRKRTARPRCRTATPEADLESVRDHESVAAEHVYNHVAVRQFTYKTLTLLVSDSVALVVQVPDEPSGYRLL